MQDPERITPDRTLAVDYVDHLARYAYARQHVTGRDVLDCGCGNGYGTYGLADIARSIVGIDIAAEAITYARAHYVHPHLRFEQMDSQRLEFADAAFDVVCSFEVIEHVQAVDRYLSEIRRVLRPAGLALLSTPNRLITSPGLSRPLNPHHEREYSPAELGPLLAPYFASIEVWGEFESPKLEKTRQQMKRWRGRWHAVDRLGLRRLFPRDLKRKMLSAFVRTSGGNIEVVSDRDLYFSQDQPDAARNLLIVTRKAAA
jgi:ubiquinone/menaquinone biosynthesis C-methylase UbiE